ncbi:MAG: hypothetical protein NUV67_03830 [archaeon]|nr:hypothetical protein [archaeon]
MKNNSRNALVLLAIAAFLLSMAAPGFAHTDPLDCVANGVSLSLTAFRSDGVTPIGAGTVQSAEPIKYRAILSHAGAPNCNYDGGTLTITTPDGGISDVTPIGGIPLVESGSPFLSDMVDYLVSEADVSGGSLNATADYSGGESHLGGGVAVNADTAFEADYEDVGLGVEKTAVPSSSVEFEWAIDKTVTPEEWSIFEGDTATSLYTVEVTKTEGSTSYFVEGTITITNPAQFATATITGVDDSITGGINPAVDCGEAFPIDLGPGEVRNCSYSAALPDDADRTNTATATTSGDVDGGEGNAGIDFEGVIPEETNGTVNVEDTNPGAGPWEFVDSGSVQYEQEFDCSEVEFVDSHAIFTHDNTATVIETQQSDDASVTVHCYQIETEKTADTSYMRKYLWEIEKDADQTEITLSPGEQFLVNYTVVASVTGTEDSNWMVEGLITVTNPNPDNDAVINGISDIINPDAVSPSVDCQVAFPYTLAADSNITCSYSYGLPNGDQGRENEASATLQNHEYSWNLDVNDTGATDFSGTASIVFGDPTDVIDEEVEVEDSFAGLLGTALFDESPKSFDYARFVGPFTDANCGDVTVDNTATLTANDTQAMDSDDHNVLVHVVCGCTLTQGYWKTHSEYGPAPSDDTWALLPSGADTVFYLSDMTYHEVMNTPVKGNVYYQLAHQYIAAVLNGLDGAPYPAEVSDAISDATALFNTYSPTDTAAWKGKQGERQLFNSLASTLASYNEGDIGPGHCDEDATSEQ